MTNTDLEKVIISSLEKMQLAHSLRMNNRTQSWPNRIKLTLCYIIYSGCFNDECFAKQPKGLEGLSANDIQTLKDWVAFYDSVPSQFFKSLQLLIFITSFLTLIFSLFQTYTYVGELVEEAKKESSQ
jgi:hypothetical protein